MLTEFMLNARLFDGTNSLLESFRAQSADGTQQFIFKRLSVDWCQIPGAVERVLQGLQLAPQVPFSIPLFGFGKCENRPCVVELYSESETVRRLMSTLVAAGTGVAPNEGLCLVALAAVQVAKMHEQEKVHGDICPSSLVVTPAGLLKFSDALIASSVGFSTQRGPARTEEGYLAPEQLSSFSSSESLEPARKAADVFRLGLLLYEFCTGKRLFRSEPGVALVQCQRFTGINKAEFQKIPEPWVSLLVSMLEPDETNRPSAAEVAQISANACVSLGWAEPYPHLAAFYQRGAAPPPGVLAPPISVQVEWQWQSAAVEEQAEASVKNTVVPRPSVTGNVIGKIGTKRVSNDELAALEQPEPETKELTLDEQVFALLVKKMSLSKPQLDRAKQQAAMQNLAPIDSLLAEELCSEDDAVFAYADITKMSALSGQQLLLHPIDVEASNAVSLELAQRTLSVPLAIKNKTQLLVAMVNPLSVRDVSKLRERSGFSSVVAIRAGASAIREMRKKVYQLDEHDMSDLIERSPTLVRGKPSSQPSSVQAEVSPDWSFPIELVENLAFSLGPKGQQSLSLAKTFERYLKSCNAELEQPLVALWAIIAANLAEGQECTAIPSIQMLHRVAGKRFEELEPLFSSIIDWPHLQSATPMAISLSVFIALARHFGSDYPSEHATKLFSNNHASHQPLITQLVACFPKRPTGPNDVQ
jgi:serine/threonine protein kinase